MFFVLVLFFVFLRFVFVSPLRQNEIETKTAHEIDKPPFSSSHEQVTQGKPGKMRMVFGEWKAIRPVPASTEIIYIPFDSLINVLQCSGMAAHASERGVSLAPRSDACGEAAPDKDEGEAPSGSAPCGSAAPDKGDMWEVIAAPDKDDTDGAGSDVECEDSSTSSGDPPAAALGPF